MAAVSSPHQPDERWKAVKEENELRLKWVGAPLGVPSPPRRPQWRGRTCLAGVGRHMRCWLLVAPYLPGQGPAHRSGRA